MRSSNRILMLLENNPYPQDSRVYREATTLIGAGYQVTVIAPGKPDQPWRDKYEGVTVYRYPFPPEIDGLLGYIFEYGYSLLAAYLLTIWAYFARGFDVIHAHNPPDIYVLVAAPFKLLGKKFVFDHHDLSPEMYTARFDGGGNKLVKKTLYWFEKLTFRLADHVISTNQSYQRVALERGKVPLANTTIVRNGPVLDLFKPRAPDPHLSQKAEYIFAYLGVMGVQDGLDYLLRALQHLVYDLKKDNFICLAMGSGPALDTLKEMANQLGIANHIWFTGHLPPDKYIPYLYTADICVDPDPSNPYNDCCTMIKLTEYMACAKPIVAFDLPEHRVTAGDAALYASSNDELEFARKLALLMDDRELREQMGQTGRTRIETQLAWDHHSQNLLLAYQILASKGEKNLGRSADQLLRE